VQQGFQPYTLAENIKGICFGFPYQTNKYANTYKINKKGGKTLSSGNGYLRTDYNYGPAIQDATIERNYHQQSNESTRRDENKKKQL